jgi:hypothetical protein
MKKIFAYIFILFSIFSYSQEKIEEKIVRDEYGDKYILYTDGTWEKAEIDSILQELQEKVIVDVIHLTGKRGKTTIIRDSKGEILKKIRESKDKRTFDLRITNNYSKDIKLLTYAIKFKNVYDYAIVDNINIRNLKSGESREFKETVTVGDIESRDYFFDLIYYELEEE